jgi:hemerythrin-like domain-containing protein
MVTIHHAIEDQRLFPDIRQADESLEPILARLQQEHEVIAKAIEEVDEALAAMMADPSRIEDVKRGVGRLGEVLLSHLSYEEDELLEPIARLAIVV